MKRTVLCAVLVLCLLTGCAASAPARLEFFAMDTVMNVTVYGPNGNGLANAAQEEIRRLEQLFSVTNGASEISRINQNAGRATTVSRETADLLRRCLAYSQQTGGLFDVSVYPAVKAWGFTTNAHTVPDAQTLTSLLPYIDYRKIRVQGSQVTLDANMALDLGAVAKGYAADRAAALLIGQGCQGAVLALGGNVLTVGRKPDGAAFTVAVQNPGNAADTLGTLTVPGGTAVVTSGDYQRYFEQDGKRYHHVIDPRTAAPADNTLTSVTVVADSAATADAMATALFVMGLDEGLAFAQQTDGLEALFVTRHKQIVLTEGLAGIFQADTEEYQIIL